MKEIPTIRENVYETVSESSENILLSGGNVIVSTEWGKSSHFVAPETSVYLGGSEVCLTKGGIRKRKRRLLRPSGAGSPDASGYTALEYLESSGTQYIETHMEVDATWGHVWCGQCSRSQIFLIS